MQKQMLNKILDGNSVRKTILESINNASKIKEAFAMHSGGGIWVFYGSLKNGLYFMMSDDGDVMILDENPIILIDNNDECVFDYDWQQEHCKKQLKGKERQQFCIDVIDYLKSADMKHRGHMFDGELNFYYTKFSEGLKVTEDELKTEKPSEIARTVWPGRSNKMEVLDINGKQIKTNLYAKEFPMLKGYENGYGKLDSKKSVEEVFDDLVAKGYKYIRFARLATSIRGYNDIYVLAK